MATEPQRLQNRWSLVSEWLSSQTERTSLVLVRSKKMPLFQCLDISILRPSCSGCRHQPAETETPEVGVALTVYPMPIEWARSEAELRLCSPDVSLWVMRTIRSRSLITASDATCGSAVKTIFLPPSKLQGPNCSACGVDGRPGSYGYTSTPQEFLPSGGRNRPRYAAIW
jgi:hypothetical protein